jgi:hypothetical protein
MLLWCWHSLPLVVLGVFDSLCLRYRWFSRQFLGTGAVCASSLVCFSRPLYVTAQSSSIYFLWILHLCVLSLHGPIILPGHSSLNFFSRVKLFGVILMERMLKNHPLLTNLRLAGLLLLGSVESHIVTNLWPHQSAQSMWAYLKKVYLQDNDARRFQLEHAIAMFQHGSLSIQDYYSAFLTLWHEYAALVTADVPIVALSTIQTLHATTQRDQFLMKLRPEYEFVRSALLNRSPIPSLDVCFGELLREEQRLSTQAILEQSHGSSGPGTMAFSAQGRGPPMHSRNLRCFCYKEYGHIVANCPKKLCSYCKKKGHIIKECRI